MNLPQADLKDADAKSGLAARGGATFGLGVSPISIRAEAGYDMWKIDGTSEDFHMLSVSGDAVYSFPGVGAKPYILAGLNWNQLATSVSGSDKKSNVGFNAGAGVNFSLGAVGAYIEARYVKVSITDSGTDSDVSNVPITFGIRF
jgi:opacity protein-like surface antigen